MDNTVDLHDEFNEAINNMKPGDTSIILAITKEKMNKLFSDTLDKETLRTLPDTYPIEIGMNTIVKIIKDTSSDTLRDIAIEVQKEM